MKIRDKMGTERFDSLLIRYGKYVIGVLAVIVVIALAMTLRDDSAGHTDAQQLANGVQYIRTLEARDVSEVKSQISEYRKAEMKALLEAGELSVWDQFEDYVVLGDSRAVGFYYHGFLDESRTLAFGGATIRDVATYMDQIKALNPRNIFLCYGLNDVSIGFWDTPEEYVTEYKQVMESIWAELPDAQIYVSSILIARDPAFEQSEKWRNIPDFNDALAEMCRENGYHYVDNTDLCEQYADLWDEDGIHVKKEFYEYWGANLIAEVMDDES